MLLIIQMKSQNMPESTFYWWKQLTSPPSSWHRITIVLVQLYVMKFCSKNSMLPHSFFSNESDWGLFIVQMHRKAVILSRLICLSVWMWNNVLKTTVTQQHRLQNRSFVSKVWQISGASGLQLLVGKDCTWKTKHQNDSKYKANGFSGQNSNYPFQSLMLFCVSLDCLLNTCPWTPPVSHPHLENSDNLVSLWRCNHFQNWLRMGIKLPIQ